MAFVTLLTLWIEALMLVVVLNSTGALGFTSPKIFGARLRRRRATVVSPIQMGWFDFKPVQGSGSGGSKDALDEQWAAQQAILRARRGKGLTKESLKQKYQAKPVSVEGATANIKSKNVGQTAFDDAMRFPSDSEEETEAPPLTIKFPWDKK